MCIKLFKSFLFDNVSKAIDSFITDHQLDVIHGVNPETGSLAPGHLADVIATYDELPRKKVMSNEVQDQKEIDELVRKLETYKKPVIVIKFKGKGYTS